MLGFGVLIVLFLIGLLACWLYLAGTRPQDVTDADDPPTLDTRNHLDD